MRGQNGQPPKPDVSQGRALQVREQGQREHAMICASLSRLPRTPVRPSWSPIPSTGPWRSGGLCGHPPLLPLAAPSASSLRPPALLDPAGHGGAAAAVPGPSLGQRPQRQPGGAAGGGNYSSRKLKIAPAGTRRGIYSGGSELCSRGIPRICLERRGKKRNASPPTQTERTLEQENWGRRREGAGKR